jgi:hypothetical protein
MEEAAAHRAAITPKYFILIGAVFTIQEIGGLVQLIRI